MKEKPTNIVNFPGGGAAANEMLPPKEQGEDRFTRNVLSDRTAIYMHRLQYAARLLLSMVLMALQGAVGVICRFVGVWCGLALCVLWFLPVPAGLLWTLGGISLTLLVTPLLLDLLVYWVMPTK